MLFNTCINFSELLPVENQGRQFWQIIFFLNTLIRGLHETDVLLFTFVVNVLQLTDDFLTLLVGFFICQKK